MKEPAPCLGSAPISSVSLLWLYISVYAFSSHIVSVKLFNLVYAPLETVAVSSAVCAPLPYAGGFIRATVFPPPSCVMERYPPEDDQLMLVPNFHSVTRLSGNVTAFIDSLLMFENESSSAARSTFSSSDINGFTVRVKVRVASAPLFFI